MNSFHKSMSFLAVLLVVIVNISFAQTAENKRAKSWIAFQQLLFKKSAAPWSLSAFELHELDSAQNFTPLTVCTSVKKISCPTAVLPVHDLQLKGKRLSVQNVQLNWETLGEYNSRLFVIERQTTMSNRFDSVGFLPAAGTSYGKLKYESIDANSYQNNSYYRIKEVDDDGRYMYSNVVVVAGSLGTFEVNVVPNPASGKNLRLFFVTTTANQKIDFTVTSSSGVLVIKKENVSVSTGYYQVPNSQQLSPGSYFIRVRTNDNVYTKSFVVVN